MPIPDDKTTLNFVLDKSLKHKLQVLADGQKRKLSNYVSHILEQHIIKFEKDLLEIFGDVDFDIEYKNIFGEEYEPHFTEQIDNDFQKITESNRIRGSQRTSSKNSKRNEFTHHNSDDKRIFISTEHTSTNIKNDFVLAHKNNFLQKIRSQIVNQYIDKLSMSLKKSHSPDEVIDDLNSQGVTPEMVLLLSNLSEQQFKQQVGRGQRETDKEYSLSDEDRLHDDFEDIEFDNKKSPTQNEPSE